MQTAQACDRDALLTQTDILRQMVLLGLGASHPVYRTIDSACRSEDPRRMQEALGAFDELPESVKRDVMGLNHIHDELTGND